MPTKRRHPSRGARAVALVSSVVATGGIAAALSHAEQTPVVVTTQATSASAATVVPTTSTVVGPAAAATSTGTYTDGTYTGAVESMRYGPMQVQVTVSGGRVTAVAVLQEPSDGRSQRINTQATPILESQAVAAQSAKLDGVSGATYTTVSYEASLQSALDAAAAR
jgi:uncharacterized protein with FMN-binding domain